MKLLFENWREYLVEAKGKDFLSNPLPISWEKVKNHLDIYLDTTDLMVVPREAYYEPGEPNALQWASGMMSTDFVGGARPFNVKQAQEYAKKIKEKPSDLPPIVAHLVWLGDDMDGTWRVDIIDGEHRSYAARLAGLKEIPAYIGYPEWAEPNDLYSGKVKLLEKINETPKRK